MTGHRYQGTDGPAVHGIEVPAEVAGRPVLVSFNRAEGSDMLTVSLTPRKLPGPETASGSGAPEIGDRGASVGVEAGPPAGAPGPRDP